MNKENTEYLFNNFPHLYKGKDLSLKQNLMPFGFECGNGWFTIIKVLSQLIEKEIVDNNLTDVYAVQVKEKFGGLRFYMTYTTEKIDNYIDMAKVLCYNTCEICGSITNVKPTQGWINYLCEKCRSNNG